MFLFALPIAGVCSLFTRTLTGLFVGITCGVVVGFFAWAACWPGSGTAIRRRNLRITVHVSFCAAYRRRMLTVHPNPHRAVCWDNLWGRCWLLRMGSLLAWQRNSDSTKESSHYCSCFFLRCLSPAYAHCSPEPSPGCLLG